MPTNGEIAGTSSGREIVNCRVAAIERVGGTFAKIARELCGIAFSDVADYVTVAEGGEVQAIPTDKIPKRKRKAIKKIREKRRILNTPGDKGDVILDQATEYELYDKLDALKYLCRLRGDEVQKIDHKHTFAEMTDEELDRRLEEKLNGIKSATDKG